MDVTIYGVLALLVPFYWLKVAIYGHLAMAVYMSCCGIHLTITLHQISPFLFFCTELCDQVGGPTPQQAAGYEEFARCLPGFLPSSSAAAGAKVRHL